jgi:hypothetical protein
LAVAVLLVTELCQRGIARRARPAVGPDLLAADEAIRRMASWSVAYGATGLITLLAAFEAVLIALQPGADAIVTGSYGSGLGVATTPDGARAYFVWVGIALFIGAVALARQAGRMVRPEARTLGRTAAQALP